MTMKDLLALHGVEAPLMEGDTPTYITLPFGYGEIDVLTRDAIIALQDLGYLIYEGTELPEVTEKGDGVPRLPAHWGRHGNYYGDDGWVQTEVRPKADLYYEEALGKLALSQYWAKRVKALAKRREGLVADIKVARSMTMDSMVDYLLGRGWRR